MAFRLESRREACSQQPPPPHGGMSLRVEEQQQQQGGGSVGGPHNNSSSSYLPAYRSQRASRSFDDGSSYEGDRPLSRLTLLDSTSDDFDEDEELSLADLDSPSHHQYVGDENDDDEDDSEEEEEEEAAALIGSAGRTAVSAYLQQQQQPTGGGRGPAAPHICEECSKSFASPGKLRQHEYTHTGETPFECRIPGCDKKFTSKFKLKRHILIHSQTKTFTCLTCQRAFRRKDHLKNHEKVHDPGKTVYGCSYAACGRSYNSLSSYKKHQAMHSAEEGQLDCKICKTVLLNQEELLSHLKLHAGSRAGKGNTDKKFNCGQCDKKFFTRKDLKRHSVVHTGNREFCCPYCSQRFGRKDHMTRHAKKTHSQLFDSTSGDQQQPGGRQRRLSAATTPTLHHSASCGSSNSSTSSGSSSSAATTVSSTAEPLLMLLRGSGGSRKERSVSDPGPNPALLPLAATTAVGSDQTATLFNTSRRPLLSPTGVLSAFQKLGTHDESLAAGSVFQSSSAVVRLPSFAGYPDQPLLAAVYGDTDPLGDVLCQSGSDLVSPPAVNMGAAVSSLLAVPMRDSSITTPEGGSDDDDDDRSMRAVSQPSAARQPPPAADSLFASFDSMKRTAGGEGNNLIGLACLSPPHHLASIKQEVDSMVDLFPPAPEEEEDAASAMAVADDEAAMRELLDEKDRMDIASFISEYNDEIYAKEAAAAGGSRSGGESMDTENREMEKIYIKAEPLVAAVPASSPIAAGSSAAAYGTNAGSIAAARVTDEAKEVLGAFEDDELDQLPLRQAAKPAGPALPLLPTSYVCTATVLTKQQPTATAAGAAAVVPRPIFIRTQSQDSLTRTKNPVLPNIHAELLPLVVPEPRLARYQNQPTAETPFTLDDFDEGEDAATVAATAAAAPPQQHQQQQQLTELKGSLFLADDYSQAYFQPWN